jgi:hypothetical protein
MDYDINGPINFFRLEHDKKVIYIFFDLWVDYNYLTDCSLVSNPLNKSIDIDKFLIKFLNNTDENIDFFIQAYKKQTEQSIPNKREIYINQVIKLPNNVNNKKVHFIYDELENKYIIRIMKIVNYYDTFATVYDYNINNIIFDMKKVLKYLKKIMKIKINLKFDKKNILELIDLLESNRENLIYGINDKIFFELQSKIYNLLFMITNSIGFFIETIYNSFYINLIFKNNNKSIFYFPYNSGIILILILVKYFDFKITDRFFSDPIIDKESITELNKIIKKLDMNYESVLFMRKMFIYKNKDDNIIQCINFINLPMLT